MTTLSAITRDQLIRRLRRIEGQARGVRRMIEEDRECQDILTQLAAIRGAAHQVSVMVVKEYALNCLSSPEEYSSSDEAITKMVHALTQLPH
ncbi:MAG: metal-sensitive transcriptional regulator [Anaerolineales bacterium]|nr:MAG: metal-sensitive transcriptional regulator [Anaerolineales bacterium]